MLSFSYFYSQVKYRKSKQDCQVAAILRPLHIVGGFIMSGRKKIYKFEPFEATSGVGRTAGGSQKLIYIDQQGRGQRETSTQIAYSMLVSPAFKDLTARQRMLYIYAKSQFYGARDRPCNTYPDVEEYQQHRGMMHFYLNHNLLSGVFGLYSKDNHRCLYNDIKKQPHYLVKPKKQKKSQKNKNSK